MNYISHLNHWFEMIRVHQEVKPTHITIYFILFQLWNTNRFSVEFSINRHEMINLSKLGSTSTYSKCMADLHRWGWINYKPSTSKYGVSTVALFPWGDNTESDTTLRSPRKKPPSNYSSTQTPKKSSSDTSSALSTDMSSDLSTASSSDLSSEQEVGHLLKHKNNKPQTDINNNINNNFKSKFYEPL